MKRDNYICKLSKQNSSKLVVHHLEGFANNKELRFALDNGITLSKDIHNLFHQIFGNFNNTRQQFLQFRGIMGL